MNVSIRIQAIVREIQHENIADIGTDHAYIPIHALACGRAKRAVACDLNARPLAKAAQNIMANGYADRIEIRQGSGLLPLVPGEVDTAVIAGLGGALLIHILCEGATQAQSLSQMILSPQSDLPLVRRFMHEIGFLIHDEILVFDGGKFYFILDCRKGSEGAYTEMEYALGKRLVAKRDAVFLQFAAHERTKLLRVKRRIEQGSGAVLLSAEAQARLAEIERMLRYYEAIG